MLCADRRGVAFEASDLKKADDGYTLTVEIFDFDYYQIDDILNLKVGETELILSVMPIHRSQ